MTCKDCIHIDLCGTFTRPCMPDEVNAEEYCKDFKNKADFAEIEKIRKAWSDDVAEKIKTIYELKAEIEVYEFGEDDIDNLVKEMTGGEIK